LTPAILPGVNGRPILASAGFNDIDNPLSGDQLSDIGIAHTIAAPSNTPMMLIFFMAVSRLELQRSSSLPAQQQSDDDQRRPCPRGSYNRASAGPDEPAVNVGFDVSRAFVRFLHDTTPGAQRFCDAGKPSLPSTWSQISSSILTLTHHDTDGVGG
jgi:hypothetical protein